MAQDLFELELSREATMIDLSMERFTANQDRLYATKHATTGAIPRVLLQRLINPLAEAIQDFIDPPEKTRGWNAGNKAALRAPMINSGLTPLELAFCTLTTIFNDYFSPDSNHLLSRVATNVSLSVQHSAELKVFQAEHKHDAASWKRQMLARHGSLCNAAAARSLETALELFEIPELNCTKGRQVQFGSKLIELLQNSTGAFQLVQVKRGIKDTPWVIEASDELLELVGTLSEHLSVMFPRYLPMVVPPKDWTNLFDGGYYQPLRSLHPAMIKCGKKERRELMGHEMPNVYSAINTIQQTPWRINSELYKVAQALWDNGGDRAGLPPASALEKPVPPCGRVNSQEWEQWKSTYPEEYKRWARECMEIHRLNAHSGSLQVMVTMQLKTASDHLEFDEIYFPWTADFRGRVYPMVPYVNPQANDLGKALLLFAEAKRLTPQGAYWLKIHLANCAGVDKVSFEARIQWVQEHQEAIVSCADDPLGNRWWEELDSPFCFLAAAMEYRNYLVHGDGYCCALPIAMDGTCNGLQHLSAMLRDPVGGEAVNLVPAAAPADIYTEVLAVVERKLDDIIAGKTKVDDATEVTIAQLWRPYLSRSLVKRPVMTTPYGVTKFGISDQLAQEAVAGGWFKGCAIKMKDLKRLMTGVVIEAISEVIVAAPLAMGWMQECAAIITESAGEAPLGISWIVPLTNFKVLQRYYDEDRERIDLFVGSARVRVQVDKEDQARISARRQLAGISPNLIHSMDAGMLMATINTLHDKLGLRSFALIHDSYGVHACDVPLLHQVLRHTFVKMYSNDVLMTIKQSWEAQYQVELPELPPAGTLDIEMVNYSKYFFA